MKNSPVSIFLQVGQNYTVRPGICYFLFYRFLCEKVGLVGINIIHRGKKFVQIIEI